MVDLLNEKFKSLYTPSGELTLDEAVIPFRGQLRFKVYMKNKPNKYGARLEVVADASNGVVMASYYPMYRKTVKWWKKLFFGLFTMA